MCKAISELGGACSTNSDCRNAPVTNVCKDNVCVVRTNYQCRQFNSQQQKNIQPPPTKSCASLTAEEKNVRRAGLGLDDEVGFMWAGKYYAAKCFISATCDLQGCERCSQWTATQFARGGEMGAKTKSGCASDIEAYGDAGNHNEECEICKDDDDCDWTSAESQVGVGLVTAVVAVLAVSLLAL